MIIKCKHNTYIYNLGIKLLGIIILIDYTQTFKKNKISYQIISNKINYLCKTSQNDTLKRSFLFSLIFEKYM